MLTSSMVQINVTLPESDSKAVAPSDLIVMMTKAGDLSFNGKKIKKSNLKAKIRSTLAGMERKDHASLSIVAEVGVPWKKINDMMKMAAALKIKAHIATQPRK